MGTLSGHQTAFVAHHLSTGNVSGYLDKNLASIKRQKVDGGSVSPGMALLLMSSDCYVRI